jgi:pimeloyl-ACP methyl ester carboxylesterase
MTGRPNIVLVHGAWADGSCWSGVIERLQAEGFQVRAPQFPLSSLADDVTRLRQVLEFQDGPTILVGHSYGGQVITALGPDAPNAVGLVYIAASPSTKASRSAHFSPRDRSRRHSPICSPTHAASAGSPKTISSTTSPAMSTRPAHG